MELSELFPIEQGQSVQEQTVHLVIYADEIKKTKNPLGYAWMYIGILVIRTDDRRRILDYLLASRRDGQFTYWGEIHFTKLNRCSDSGSLGARTRVARRWMKLVMSEHQPRCIHFHILGLNLTNLQHRAFGVGKDRARNIYNRFFRSAVSYCLKWFFGEYSRIVVDRVFHDKSELENDGLFDWHTIWRIDTQEEGITFNCDNIRFIDSDHSKEPDFPDDSHFIQLIDLILGATRQCLDAPNRKAGCNEIGELFLPLVERLNDPARCNNPNSRYDYWRKCSLSFFPRTKLTITELANPLQRARSGFYRRRRLLLKERLSGQMTLDL